MGVCDDIDFLDASVDCSELMRLKQMLEENGIPYQYSDNTFACNGGMYGNHQICCPKNGPGRYISVIQGPHSYGGPEGHLEIMGLLEPEDGRDSVAGWLSAENVFKRIQKHLKEAAHA